MTQCKLCSSDNTESLILDKVYHHCKNCDFIFMDRSYLISESEEKARYLQHNNTMENRGYVKMFQDFIVNALEPQYSSAKQLLDVGCGPNPVFAQIMRNQGKAVDVYDPFFFPSDDYLHKHYELITLTEVIEHIQYPLQSLRPLKGCLSPAGLLAIMTRIHPGIDAFENWWYRMDNTHISFFSVKTAKFLARLFDMTFLRTDSERYFCFQERE